MPSNHIHGIWRKNFIQGIILTVLYSQQRFQPSKGTLIGYHMLQFHKNFNPDWLDKTLNLIQYCGENSMVALKL